MFTFQVAPLQQKLLCSELFSYKKPLLNKLMKPLKKFKNNLISKSYSLTKKYWLQNYFTRFFFYQNSHALKFNLNYLGFGFSASIFFNRLIASTIKNLSKKRFIFSTPLINPFFYARLSLKNYFAIDNCLNYYFNDGIFFSNSFVYFEDLIFSFCSRVTIFNNNLFFNNSISTLRQLTFFSGFIKKQTTYFFLKNNFFFLKNFKKSVLLLSFIMFFKY